MSSVTSRKKEETEKKIIIDPEAANANDNEDNVEKYSKRKNDKYYRFMIAIEVLIIIITSATLLNDFLHREERQRHRLENESSLQKSIEDLKGTLLQQEEGLEKLA